MRSRYFLYYILPIIIYCAAIFYHSSQSVITGPIGTFAVNDKVKHAAAYLILSALTYRAANKSKHKKYAYIIAIIFATLYGISDEIHQFFVPGRVMSGYDMIANGVGSLIILLKKVGKRTQR